MACALCCVLCLSCLLIPIGFLIWLAKKLDSDLTLTFYEKFGKPISSLRGKVIWITGASSGIGQSLAVDLAAGGAKLALSGTNLERLEETKKQCLTSGKLSDEDILLVPFNIADFKSHEDCIKKVLDHFKTVDILVNNAGRTQRAAFQSIEIQVDKDMFDINVFGGVNLTRKLIPHFLERGCGHVVVTSSIAGKFGIPDSASYTASKHALHGYFECLRTELSNFGISVTMVCPGPTFAQGLLANAFTEKSGEVFAGEQQATDKRMSTSRCTHLIAIAIANRLDEVWISLQPVLTTYYLAQYMPTIFRQVVLKRYYTKERAAAIREGKI